MHWFSITMNTLLLTEKPLSVCLSAKLKKMVSPVSVSFYLCNIMLYYYYFI